MSAAADTRISIVTVVMNRQAHLWATLPEISRWPGHAEHVIVDWSSQDPIERERLPADPRIQLVRVEGETRWQLTRAYNFAISMASHEVILKLDADCWIDSRYPEAIVLKPNTYLRSAAAGGLNGIFMIHRRDFFAAGGFNEYLCGYGHDDKDLYQRLEKNLLCEYFPTNLFLTIEHGDMERVAAAQARETTPDKRLGAWQTLASIASMERSKAVNRWLAEKMPWTQENCLTTYTQQGSNIWSAERSSIPVPPDFRQAQAKALGSRIYLSNLLGLPERFLEGEIPPHDLEQIQTWKHFLRFYSGLRATALISLLKLAVVMNRGYRRLVRR